MIDKERMRTLAAGEGIALAAEQLEQLEQYAALLHEWNQKINLTAISQPQEVEVKHFLDCLLLARQPEIAGSLVDVGSGAGFPGVVVGILKPQVQLTLMEPTGKRVAFLQQLCQSLGVRAQVVKERAEEAARKQWRESFDVATARAVAALPVLCEYCLPLVRSGGCFIAMKGDAEEEVQQAQPAMQKLGGRLRQVQQYSLPDGSSRSLVIIEKVEETPAHLPRAGGVIKKRALK